MAAVMSKLLVKVASHKLGHEKKALNLTPAMLQVAKGTHIPGFGLSASEKAREAIIRANRYIGKNRQLAGGVAGAATGAVGGGVTGAVMDPDSPKGTMLGAAGGAAGGAILGAGRPGQYLMRKAQGMLGRAGKAMVGGRQGMAQLQAGRVNKLIDQEARHAAGTQGVRNLEGLSEEELSGMGTQMREGIKGMSGEREGLGGSAVRHGKGLESLEAGAKAASVLMKRAAVIMAKNKTSKQQVA